MTPREKLGKLPFTARNQLQLPLFATRESDPHYKHQHPSSKNPLL
jgi:hypothetical protein